MIDEKVDLNSVDEEELEANEITGELLFGRANIGYYFRRQYNGKGLAKYVEELAEKERVSAGLIAWNYAWNTGNWAFTKKALTILEPEANAPLQINKCLQERLDWDKLSEDSQDHLKLSLKLEDS